MIDDRLSMDAGRAAEQLRLILDQRYEPVVHGLKVGLNLWQVVGIDTAERLRLGVVEYRSELGERRMRCVRI